MNWIFMHPQATKEMLGYIPMFLSETNPKPAKQQIDQNYQHGGGWHTFRGHILQANDHLKYPGDQPLRPLAKTQLRDETIIIYEQAWVAIIQKDRSFEVAKID